MSASALWWLPDAVIAQVARAADGVLTAWAEAWGLAAPKPVRAVRWRWDEVCAVSELDRAALGDALLGQATRASALAGRVTAIAMEQLFVEIETRFGKALAGQAMRPRPGDRGLVLSIDLPGQLWCLPLSCEQLHAKAWLARPTGSPLAAWNPEIALAGVPVPLEIELGQASLPVSELLKLAVDDVIVLKQSVGAPLSVSSPGSALALRAQLGAAASGQGEAKRALRWLAADSSSSSFHRQAD